MSPQRTASHGVDLDLHGRVRGAERGGRISGHSRELPLYFELQDGRRHRMLEKKLRGGRSLERGCGFPFSRSD